MLTTEPRLPGLPHLSVLQAGSTAPAIVLVPGLLGLGMVFARFARAVAAGRAIYAFDLPGSDSEEPVRELAIEEIADLFEPQLRAICTHSPVVLGGYSLGALIALELALRLQRRGRAVSQLWSFDGFAPQYTQRAAALRARCMAHARAFRAEPASYARGLMLNVRRHVLARLGQEWRMAEQLHSNAGLTERIRGQRLAAFRQRAVAYYRPQARFRGPLRLLRLVAAFVARGLSETRASASLNASVVPTGGGPLGHESEVTLSSPISGDASL
jgi:thioesterase domain-containing protein